MLISTLFVLVVQAWAWALQQSAQAALVGGEDKGDELSLLQSHGTIERVCSGFIVPPVSHSIHNYTFGAVYNSTGSFLKESQRFPHMETNWYKFNPYPPNYENFLADTVTKLDVQPDEKVLFVHGVSHYGHFLFETISRFWPMLHQEFQVIVMIWHHGQLEGGAEMVSELLAEASGVKAPRLIHLTGPVKFDSCVYAAGYCFDDENAQLLKQLYTTLPKMNKVTPKDHIERNVYCLRESGMNFHERYGRMWDEKPLADMFEKEFGFSVIEPGNYTKREQLSIFGNADIVVGRVGTAMHNALFLLNPNVHVILLEDDRSPNPLQLTIFNLMQIHTYQVFPFIGQMKGETGSFTVDTYRLMMQNFFRGLEKNGD